MPLLPKIIRAAFANRLREVERFRRHPAEVQGLADPVQGEHVRPGLARAHGKDRDPEDNRGRLDGDEQGDEHHGRRAHTVAQHGMLFIQPGKERLDDVFGKLLK